MGNLVSEEVREKLRAKSLLRPATTGIRLEITNDETNEITIVESISKGAAFLGVHPTSLHKVIKSLPQKSSDYRYKRVYKIKVLK